MNPKQVHKYLQRYLETTECDVLEKSPAHFLVKLSPRADRQLTNRPYYWGFVDRTGVEPETMSLLMVTHKEKYEREAEKKRQAEAAQAQEEGRSPATSTVEPVRRAGYLDSLLNQATARVPRADYHYGSGKLEQLFASAKEEGSYLCLFQEPDKRAQSPLESTPYTGWLGINYKVEFACDLLREEIHTIGISLNTGSHVENFYEHLAGLKLTPRIPANVHMARQALSLSKAMQTAEQIMERKLATYDYTWATAARERLELELATIKHYYEPLLRQAQLDKSVAHKPAVPKRKLADTTAASGVELGTLTEQYAQREKEIRWQYEPRVNLQVINCGIFYLPGIE
jgi:hypothetical protein